MLHLLPGPLVGLLPCLHEFLQFYAGLQPYESLASAPSATEVLMRELQELEQLAQTFSSKAISRKVWCTVTAHPSDRNFLCSLYVSKCLKAQQGTGQAHENVLCLARI